MAAPRCGEGESLQSMKGKAWVETGASGNVQNRHDPESWGRGRREGKGKGEREPGTKARKPKVQKRWATKISGLYRKKKKTSGGRVSQPLG